MLHASSSSSPSHADGGICWSEELARHEKWLRTVLAARLGSAAAVDEVMQEVALIAVKQRAPLLDRDRIAPWLYRVAVRQALLYRRRHGRMRKHVARYATSRIPDACDDGELDPLHWLLHDERLRQVRSALERMPAREREILLLKYEHDWTYEQIADHLGATKGAVESRLHRAREKMRCLLKSQGLVEMESK